MLRRRVRQPTTSAGDPPLADSAPDTQRPAIWAIGDVHGCCQSLDALLASPEIAGDPTCRFWFVGDLVNRGPANAETLRRVMSLGDRATVVLGNHDLRALGLAAGCLRPDSRDTLQDLFDAPDAGVLLDWLRAQPLIHVQDRHILAHAGLYPGWDVLQAMAHAGEVEAMLRDSDWRRHMRTLSGAAPLAWNAKLDTQQRLRFIVSAFTRMRLCTRNAGLAPGAKSTPGRWPRETLPWYDLPRRAGADKTIVFGHWATLGLLVRTDVVCLDTGCVTGGPLTAYRLSDRKLVQVTREALTQVA
ncbi:symmetrical bis(5'-nucleosyl)-tetraphosphatase [Achromobacter sp.]|uniref:symmetrical bis(5'-nucleosyl)-tetraphosphatase n=1 Tax=Achromobacter sp. TaxID=134375 RepID=UPI0028ACD83F|nr:symmetrical bis(5'-nucleosyl)-tetraphosphatase [Achromobacter sp.]